MISISRISRTFSGRSVLRDVSLEARDAGIIGLVGLNGAGKSTLLKIAAGILYPDSGSVTVDGIDMLSSKREAAHRIGHIPELPNYETFIRPGPLLKFFAGFYGIKGKDADDRVKTVLDQVGLKDYGKRRIGSFSQGMKKRFSIASGIIHDPHNILLDESLSNLDPRGVQAVRSLILQWRREGRAIILSSHDLPEL